MTEHFPPIDEVIETQSISCFVEFLKGMIFHSCRFFVVLIWFLVLCNLFKTKNIICRIPVIALVLMFFCFVFYNKYRREYYAYITYFKVNLWGVWDSNPSIHILCIV